MMTTPKHNPKDNALIVFAREPKPGQVKTRMLKSLDKTFVTDLYKAFIQDVIHVAANVDCGGKFLYFADQEGDVPFLQQFDPSMTLCRQTPGSLGERMYRALCDVQTAGYQRMQIIGTDCIELSVGELEQTFENLLTNDYCVGPSLDGGYYLIGTCTPQLEVFTGIDWGTDTVKQATIDRITALNKSYTLLSEKEDMDTLESIQHFYARMSQSSATHTRHLLSTNPLPTQIQPTD